MHTLMPHSKPDNSPAHLSQALLTACADVMLKPTATSAVQQLCDELVEQVPELKLVNPTPTSFAHKPLLARPPFTGTP
jgi:hypothetical protein